MINDFIEENGVKVVSVSPPNWHITRLDQAGTKHRVLVGVSVIYDAA